MINKATLTVGALALTTAMALAQAGHPNPGNDITRARVNTLLGPTGLINVPSAYVVPQDRIVLGTFFGRNKTLMANYGLLNSLEVGATYFDRENASDKYLANAKLNIIPSNLVDGIQFGVGVIDAADAVDRTFYFMASGEVLPPDILTRYDAVGLRLHAGVGSGLYREKFLAGAEILFGPKLSGIAEYDGRNGNFGVRYIHDEVLRAQAGIEDKKFFFSFSVAFNP